MRLRILLLAAPLVAAALAPARGALIVDFGSTASGGSPVAPGMTSGNVPNNPSSGAGPITYVDLSNIDTGGFGTAAVQGVVTMSSGDIPSNTFRAVNRGAPVARSAAQNLGLNNETPNTPLFQDWIGITQMSTLNEEENVITLNPSPTLTFTVSGLDPGEYIWTSWHHDTGDQTGLINYTFTDALGVAAGVIDASHGTNQVTTTSSNGSNTGLPQFSNSVNGRGASVNGTGDPGNNPPGMPMSFTHQFTVDGTGSFSFAMSSGFDPSLLAPDQNLPFTTTSLNFAFINGFEVTPVPEPSTICLAGSFAVVAALVVRRRKR